jgi:DNA-directed RNA polymerase sigma subunit (sigma70/sigma32)
LLSSDAIPQHDRLDDLVRLLREPDAGVCPVSDRQREYRHHALSILGLFDRRAKVPTPFGAHLRSLPEREAMAGLIERVRDCEVFRAWMNWSEVSSTAEIDPDTALAFVKACSALAPSTALRRSRSLHAWWRSAHVDAAFHGTQAVLPLASSAESMPPPDPGTAAHSVACLAGLIDDSGAIANLRSPIHRLAEMDSRMTADAELAVMRDLQDLEAMLFVHLRTDEYGEARWTAFVQDYNGKLLDDVDQEELALEDMGERLATLAVGMPVQQLPRLRRRLRSMLEDAGVRRPVRSAFVVHATRDSAPGVLSADLAQFHEFRWHLLAGHLGIVGKVAQRYRLGFPYEDAFTIALGGGLDGVDRWEEGRGGNLATVVSIWARARLTRAVGQYRHGRHRSGTLNESRTVLYRTRQEWVRDAREVPDWSAIAEAWRTRGEGADLKEVAPRSWWTDELDAPCRPDLSGLANLVALDALPDDLVADLERVDGMIRAWLAEQVNPRVRYVLEERYGLRGNESRTLSAVGAHLNLSRERIRQLERDGLRDLVSHFSKPGTTTPTT